ncbi:peptidoglycan editing factor PgeF [Nocardioides sp. Kera G14]|uniref:peptidoglycan editing factor PgeF n=1 Tax=Nocardioides sp. Kera G14 TaxID=2884264 RepID=UPI001D0FEC22|nr:peptidoglycan editing factor PgeF [Nocardioides sp. Kera G14]UDY22483.1 peptidoglycan editing factor PgeF [Nocardioides sp. Kera G14]
MYLFRTSTGPVDLAFTDRLDGVSAAPWDSLNLAVSGDDAEESKRRNHELLLADFAPGAQLADLYQVHSATVVDAIPGAKPQADALVTTDPDVVLMVRAADCVPVLLADERAGVIGAAHAGRKGMASGVVPATVERMRTLGATDITAWIGPSICGDCYEVPADMRAEISCVEPDSASTTSWGTPALDVAAGVRAQLWRDRVEVVDDAAACTRERADLYSFRRDGEGAGRLAGVIRLRSAA